MSLRHGIGLLGWCGLCLGIGLAGSLATRRSVNDWYVALQKPFWTPPSWFFAPVWTMLYVLMGIAAWKIWKTNGFSGAKIPLTLFLIQLFFNGAWSFLFFGARNIVAGLVDISLLWSALAATVAFFLKNDTVAGMLLLPYLAWVSFAAFLNLKLYLLNR